MKPTFLVFDKPAGITSHDAVALVRAVTGIDKVGHTGTLDPFATGVLPIALGPATKLVQFIDESIKVYDLVVAFGAQTDTGDPTGRVVREAPAPTHGRAEVESILRGFLGDRMQSPPAFSAVKKDGKPLYYYARKGIVAEVEPRAIRIHAIDCLAYDHETLHLSITCSRGTYARVLADEIAVALGSAGHVSVLKRCRSGPFFLEDALGAEALGELVAAEEGHSWSEVLLSRGRKQDRVPWKPREAVLEALSGWFRRPLDVLSHLPLADVRPQDALRVASGAPPPPAPTACRVGDRYLVVCGDDLVAVAEKTPQGGATIRVLSSS